MKDEPYPVSVYLVIGENDVASWIFLVCFATLNPHVSLGQNELL